MAVKIPNVRLNNGYEMPIFGFGTYNALEDEMTRCISEAIDAGYRHIDGAAFYQNEVYVGRGIQNKIREGVVERKDLFMVSKLWPNSMRPDLVEGRLRQTLKDLQLDYLDLYLIHWPMPFKEGPEWEPLDENGMIIASNVDFVDTWKAMEECVRKGLVRSIGVSNFNSQQLNRLLPKCTIKPVTNQVEVHAYLPQKELNALCNKYGIILTAYGPLGRPGFQNDPSEPILIEDPLIKQLAVKYGKTPGQICLRFLTKKGFPVIPKSSTKQRIYENLASLEIDLSEEDMAALDGLGVRNYRNNWLPYSKNHPEYPFYLPY